MNSKDTIYVDVEDEITGIIDKVNSSKSKIVALVLPKRATVFQSIVNMKLLKRKADDAKKNVVLVTSEAGLMPLAGAVGVHVAKTLEAKPAIPPAPTELDEGPVDADEIPGEEELDKSLPIGELAGAAAVGGAVAKGKQPIEDDAIEVDNDSDDPVAAASAATASADKADKDKADKKAKKGKNKKLKVPDFDRFRKYLIIGGAALVALIILFILAFKILPKATVIIQTNTSAINTNLSVTLNSTTSSLDTTNLVIPAHIQTVQKTATSTAVNTTGQKTVGTSASGTVTVTNNNIDPATYTIPAGTVFTDPSGNFSYTSNTAETISGFTGHAPHFNDPSVNVPVTATQVGPSYNIAAASGYTSNDANIDGYSMSGSAMNGGTSQNVQIVTQADVSSAESQLTAPNTATIKQQIAQSLTQADLEPLTSTFVAGTPTNSPSAAVGTQANSITVTQTTTYTMYGVTQSNLQTIIDDNVNKQINTSQQSILDSGASKATFNTQTTTTTSLQGSLQATSTVGPNLNINQLKGQVAGQRSGDIKSSVGAVPGVTNVVVKYSPFWVSSTPKNTSKISIVIQKSNGSAP